MAGLGHLFNSAIFSQNEESTANTTADNMQVIWVAFADSNYDGQGPTDITCPPGILYKWNGVSLTEITTQSTANGGSFGAFHKQFAIDYNALTGKKVVLVNSARGGSRLYPNGIDPYDWYTTGGIMRAQATAQIDACLNYLGLSEPIATFGNAVINDIRNPTSFANITLGFDSAVAYVTGKFPGVPFLYSLPGHDGNGNLNSVLQRQCRNMIVQKQRTTADFYIDSTCMSFNAIGYGTLHFNDQAAYNYLGSCKARWFANAGRSKYARTIISCHWSTLTEARKDKIEAEIASLGNLVYDDLEYLYHYMVPDSKDQFLDYCLITAPQLVSTTFVSDSHIAANGTNAQYWLTNFVPSTLSLRCSQNDEFHAAWIKAFTSDATTLRSAFGMANAAARFTVGHTTTGVYYHINDITVTTARTGVLAANTLVSAVRTASNAGALWENGVVTHSTTKASTGRPDQNNIIGGRNVGGSNSVPGAGEFEASVGGKATTVNQLTLYTIFNTRRTGW